MFLICRIVCIICIGPSTLIACSLDLKNKNCSLSLSLLQVSMTHAWHANARALRSPVQNGDFSFGGGEKNSFHRGQNTMYPFSVDHIFFFQKCTLIKFVFILKAPPPGSAPGGQTMESSERSSVGCTNSRFHLRTASH